MFGTCAVEILIFNIKNYNLFNIFDKHLQNIYYILIKFKYSYILIIIDYE